MRGTRALVVLLPTIVHAALPLSKQHPLIARVDQPYSWTISPLTFDNWEITSILLRSSPDWLIYDNNTSTFRGTPAAEDVGVTTVRVRNDQGHNDHFLLCVSELPSPIVNMPLASQLVPGNPSISSGFTFPAPNVGIRVPPKWSFSIGFDGLTFTTPDERNIFYDATLANGLSLPDWVVFNNRSLTFDGVAPPENRAASLSIILYGSDTWGFGAIHERFDLVVGPRTHLLGIDGTSGLETVNVTGGTPFVHSIQTFGGLMIDGVQVVAANVSQVEVDVTSVPWATFDQATRVLSGVPPMSMIGQSPRVLPVSITSDYNDTVATNITVTVFPSYFTAAPILPLAVTRGTFISTSTEAYLSHARSAQASIVSEYVPRAASSWLTYVTLNNTLSGFVPRSTTYDEVNVTFYATDLETHAVSTSSLLLSITPNVTSGPGIWGHQHGHNVSGQAKTALVATFSIIGGAILLCCLLAICRCYCGAREVQEDDENSSQWKNQDIISSGVRPVVLSEKMLRGIGLSRTSATSDGSSEVGHKLAPSILVSPKASNSEASPKAPTIKKVHFFQNLLTASKRKLRDQGLGSQSGKIRRSQISQPTPIDKDTLAHMQIAGVESMSHSDSSENSGQLGEQRGAGNLGVVDSVLSFGWPRARSAAQDEPSSLENSAQVLADRSSQVISDSDDSSLTSVPRRRSDFLPPRHQRAVAPEQVHGASHASSLPSSRSSGTINMEFGEATVISTAARQALPNTVSTTSVDRDMVRSSMDSAASTALSKRRSESSSPGSMSITGVRKPRLVQLNSERCVPTQSNGGASTVRNVSQKVVVGSSSNGRKASASSQECDQDQRLSLGIHYVPSFGEDDDAESAVFYMTPSVGKAPTPRIGAGKSQVTPADGVGSFGARSVSAKSMVKNKDAVPQQVPNRQQQQTRLPIGAPFALSVKFETIPARGADIAIRQQNGKSAPAWINLDQRDVELWGVPLKEHRGTHSLEVVEITQGGQRVVARMILEVIDWE
ncbi:hypothetical protein BDV93DRAFT_608626 [Ceratobasidium sp. AG-I]|nr:hypothetical protein BDV93DRAFT_608626 [Ceratobasidium sp. AG-I]